MTVISIPRIIQERLTPEGAEALVGILDKIEERTQKVTLEIAEERFERRVSQVESRLEAKIETLRAELTGKIAQTEARLIRWMFLFWIGQFASIVGVLTAILFAFFRK
jgi:hypothetical protein